MTILLSAFLPADRQGRQSPVMGDEPSLLKALPEKTLSCVSALHSSCPVRTIMLPSTRSCVFSCTVPAASLIGVPTYVKATQNSTSTPDKTVGYLDGSQWVGRWWVVREGKEEDKTSPLFSFSQILVLLLVINNSILNI